MSVVLACSLAAGLLALAAPVLAIGPNAEVKPDTVFQEPFDVRITGYVNGAPEGVSPERTWYLDNDGKRYELEITDLFVFEGGVLPGDIDQALVQYKNELTLKGDAANLERFRALKPKEKTVIEGKLTLQGGFHTLTLKSVKPATAEE